MARFKKDRNDFIEVEDNKLSKPGIFEYLGSEIGAPDPKRIYRVLRPIEELSDPECAASFKLKPWVLGHDMLGDGKGGTMDAAEKGVHGVIGEKVYFDAKDNWLKGNIKMFSQSLKSAIRDGVNELSLGYRCIYDFTPGTLGASIYKAIPGVPKGMEYDVVQRKIRGNHVASVESSRMDVAVGDERFTGDQSMKITIEKGNAMERKSKAGTGKDQDSVTIEDVMVAFKAAAPLFDVLQKFSMSTPPEENDEVEDEENDDPMVNPVEDEDYEDENKEPGEGEDEENDEAKENGKGQDGKGDTMDAKTIEKTVIAAVGKAVAPLNKRLGALEKSSKGMDASVFFKEAAERDALADTISRHVGAFDHSSMTLQQVAEYGVEKLEIPCEKGHEKHVIKAYLHNRGSAPKLYSVGDSKPATGDSFVDKYLNEESK